MSAAAPQDPARAEHDALARRLSARRSIDEVRKAAYAGFAGLVAVGLSAKLAYDRWFTLLPTRSKGQPVFFYCAAAAAALLLALAATWALRARRHMREEDALFARFRALRDKLGLP